MKLPAIQFYVGDWLKDPAVRALTLEERGAWFELLLAMHECEPPGTLTLNGRQMTSKEVANILNVSSAKARQILDRVVKTGAASRQQNGTIINRRMYRNYLAQKALSEKRRQAGSKGAAKANSKWVGKTSAKAATSSSSSSSAAAKIQQTGKTDTQETPSEKIIKLWNEGKPVREQIRLTPTRKRKIESRLKDGFTEEQLVEVTKKLKESEWHQGGNPNGWRASGPEWVLNSFERVEQWIAKGGGNGPASKRWPKGEDPADLGYRIDIPKSSARPSP